MKRCTRCNIEVGGNLMECPLCRTKLVGKGERDYWPERSRFKKHSKIYKIQLYISIYACIAAFVVDMILDPFKELDWWPLFFLWVAGGEIVVRSLLRKHRPAPKIVTECAFAVCVMMGITCVWFPEYLFVIPIIISGMVVVDFCFCLADKEGYSIVFFIWSFFLGVGSFIVILIIGLEHVFTLYMLLGVCAATFLVTFLVKGRFIFSEIKRRLSL